MGENINNNEEEILNESLQNNAANDPPWDESHEKVLIEWADKAQVYRWLHTKSFGYYRIKAMWFTIPVIIMSTITGTANFAQERFPDDIKTIAVMSIGGINLFAGILTTISQYLKVNELMESHRVSSLSWDKFVRDIKMELAKDPRETESQKSQRESPVACLTRFKEVFDRLMEVSPIIEDKVIKEYLYTFDDDKVRIQNELKQRKQRILYHPDSSVPPCCRPIIKLFKCYDCFNDPEGPKRNKDKNNNNNYNKINNNNQKDIENQIGMNEILSNDIVSNNNNKGTQFRNSRKSMATILNEDKEKKNQAQKVIRPDICGTMESTALSVHPWRLLEKEKEKSGLLNITNNHQKAQLDAQIAKIKKEEAKEEEMKVKLENDLKKKKLEEANKIKNETKNRITNYILKFKEKTHRMPLVEDVKEALSDVDEDEIANHELFQPVA